MKNLKLKELDFEESTKIYGGRRLDKLFNTFFSAVLDQWADFKRGITGRPPLNN